MVCWEAGTSFQHSILIGKLDLSLLVNTLAQASNENLFQCPATQISSNKRRNQLVLLGKLLSTHTIAWYRNIVVFFLLSPSHLIISCMSAAPHPQLRQTGSAQDPGHPSAAVPGRCRHEGVLSLVLLVVSVAQAIQLAMSHLAALLHRAPGQADGVLLADPLAGDELVLELTGTQSNGTRGGRSFNLSNVLTEESLDKGNKPLYSE